MGEGWKFFFFLKFNFNHYPDLIVSISVVYVGGTMVTDMELARQV